MLSSCPCTSEKSPYGAQPLVDHNDKKAATQPSHWTPDEKLRESDIGEKPSEVLSPTSVVFSRFVSWLGGWVPWFVGKSVG